jgi:predicted ester cyclase
MTTNLSPGDMKTIVRQHFEEFVNNRHADVIRRNMTPDFLDHDGPEGKEVGIAEDEQMMWQMYEYMPDIHVEIDDMIAEGDKVVCRNVWRWTDVQRGTPMEFRGFVEWRFEGDKIAERWATVTPPRPAVT